MIVICKCILLEKTSGDAIYQASQTEKIYSHGKLVWLSSKFSYGIVIYVLLEWGIDFNQVVQKE